MAEPPQADALRIWRELLALRLPNPVCPMCTGSDWREVETQAEIGVQAVALVCASCGFIRLHARDL